MASTLYTRQTTEPSWQPPQRKITIIIIIALISIPAAVTELPHSFVPTACTSVQLFAAAAKYNTIQ